MHSFLKNSRTFDNISYVMNTKEKIIHVSHAFASDSPSRSSVIEVRFQTPFNLIYIFFTASRSCLHVCAFLVQSFPANKSAWFIFLKFLPQAVFFWTTEIFEKTGANYQTLLNFRVRFWFEKKTINTNRAAPTCYTCLKEKNLKISMILKEKNTKISMV